MGRVDIEQLVKEIRRLERHQVLYKVLKKELERALKEKGVDYEK